MVYRTTDIFRTRMHFLRVNITFYDAVNMIHDVITTAKFMFVAVRNNTTQALKDK